VNRVSEKFGFVDLFAGIGGFAAALSALGGKPVYSVEIDENAAKVYEYNWGHDPLGDITADANDELVRVSAHDVLAAGFPCQPFSKSGAQKGMDETRGTLYWNILKIIKKNHPALVVLENVRNLAGPRHKHEWEVIIDTLKQEGYRVSEVPTILSPHLIPKNLGGRPQSRDRVFITATYVGGDQRKMEKVPPIVDMAELRRKAVNLQWDLEKDLPLENNSEPSLSLTKNETLWIDAWDDWVQILRKATNKQPPGFPIWADSWTLESQLSIPDGTPAWKADFLMKNSKLYSENQASFDAWADKWGVFTEKFPPSRRKLEWQAQDAKSLWDCLMHFRPSGVRAKKPTHVPALVAITQTSIYGPGRRRLSTREVARLQGLPSWFDFGSQSDAATYKQLGNGVNVGAVWYAIKKHVERDRDYLAKTAGGRRVLAAVDHSPNSPDDILENLKG
jgi:DNA (cytosine-5)-methyltransferase 1